MKKTLAIVIGAGLGMILGGAAVLSIGPAKAASESARRPPVEAHSFAAAPKPEPLVVTDDGFEVQVLVEGQPSQEYLARGKRYVEAIEGAEYELRINNPLPIRVAVALSVDGLNTIDAKHTPAWDASKWVIGPYQTIYISGWQVSSGRARHFYFPPSAIPMAQSWARQRISA